MKVRRCNTRRGVLLLVILGVLAMFAMLAIAFVVLTRGAQRTSLTVQRIDQYVDKGADDTHLAALQLFRGPSNPASKIKSHCILEDLYGNDWQTDTLPAATGSICGGQLFEFGGLQNDPPNADATRAPQQYVGCIMTMTTGDYTGWSTRIVGVSHTGDGHLSLQALSFAGGCPESGDEYMINGAPFSGTGLIATGLTPGTPDFSEQANEDYDAVDFQNMFLAAYMPEGIIPSFHRPSLVSYNGEASREVMLRPVAEDHPNFPSIDPVNGPWDVDNDGDGIRDSIWIDIGLPVRSTADGRLYKPLASYLCLDLDGRLNINAHGNWTHVDAAGASSGTSRDDGVPPGLGYGPADISLIPLLGDNQEAAERLSTLLAGDATLEGRYGEGDLAASSDPMPGGTADNATQPPKLADDPLSQNKHFDYPANYADYNSLTTHVPTSYGTPPDLHGTMTVNLDDRGLPYYSLSEETDWQKGRVNNPYEINLSRNSASRGYVTSTGSDMAPSYGLDSPFTPAELERMLRPFDRDAGKLSSRLYRLTDDVEDPRLGQSFLTDRRHLFTTESWSQPCPSVAPPNRADATDYFHVTDIFPEALVSDATNQPIAPEILAGLRMDLNRPFGNGIDDSGSGQAGSGVVDEPGEAENEQIEYVDATGASDGTVGFDADNDGSVDSGDENARQIYARQLYVLMMTLTDNYQPSDAEEGEDRASRVAQWAVNVVDFRDRDSIMTRFQYDPNPSDGWSTDSSHVVWGCERPELLLTEGFAIHDHRTEDRDDAKVEEGAGKQDGGDDDETKDTTTVDEDNPDEDFDQRLRPQGSLFLELFNPWVNHDPDSTGATTGKREPPPGEFYYNKSWKDGVDLTKTVASTGGSQPSPIWRIAVVMDDSSDGDNRAKDPDHPNESKRPSDESIKRVIYFSSEGRPGDAEVEFYPSASSSIQPIKPGKYAVIGPGEPESTGEADTHIGLAVGTEGEDPKESDSDRRIVLKTGTGVSVLNNGEDKQEDEAVSVIIDMPKRLSVTEPLESDYYPDKDPDGGAYNETTGYAKPYDKPQDEEKNAELWGRCLGHTGTYANFCVVHLQRLADPTRPHRDGNTEDANPYLTIDSMPIDLTVFNGVDNSGNSEPDPDSGPDDEMGAVKFATRQRGEAEKESGGGAGSSNIWKHEPTSPKSAWKQPQASAGSNGQQRFEDNLRHTLGNLNEPFGEGGTGGYPTGANAFPWLTWNNRPFISQLELLMVPAVRSSKLTAVFETPKSGDASDPYSAAGNNAYPHMWNWFHSSATKDQSPQLHRIFDFVHVPSRFVGTEIQGNPSEFAGGEHNFHPPFNRISTYREPGRINLNTIFSPVVWNGLMNGFPDMDWETFKASRQGYTTEGSLPTRFAKPFRSPGNASRVPIDALKPAREIEATLLRSDADTVKGTSAKPLFVSTDYQSEKNDPHRNPYFRYEGLQRLGNLVTTRSNVFAVWVTVGYFEVSPVPDTHPNHGNTDIFPDGYMLGREIGTDSGDIKRHRAFYIFDRTIPVGFRRGMDLNVENAILLKRYIE